jgi:hypothetical protein
MSQGAEHAALSLLGLFWVLLRLGGGFCLLCTLEACTAVNPNPSPACQNVLGQELMAGKIGRLLQLRNAARR